LVYRAMSEDNMSSLGYARFSQDGYTLEERLGKPIYTPTEIFETRTQKEGMGRYVNVGCEDPRITLIGNRVYVCYITASDISNTRVALTSIEKEDFLNKRWNWEKPILISPPGIGEKDACVVHLREGHYAFFHRIYPGIWVDIRPTLKFQKDEWVVGKFWIKPRDGFWDSRKMGIASPPLEIKEGWLLIYHGVSEGDRIYRLGAAILDKDDPRKVLYRSKSPILEPKEDYELYGQTPNVVFSCGAIRIRDRLLVYYGGADTVIGVASCNLEELVQGLKAGKV
ncbi:MAG: glycosidase, partial [Candidatus Aerophobetes bacterium]|nr:glycosidase [Candidatus Aerophobetes bacterium]